MMSQKNITEAVAMPSVLEVRGAKTADRVEWIDGSSVRKKYACIARVTEITSSQRVKVRQQAGKQAECSCSTTGRDYSLLGAFGALLNTLELSTR